jgi:hypothetical protein
MPEVGMYPQSAAVGDVQDWIVANGRYKGAKAEHARSISSMAHEYIAQNAGGYDPNSRADRKAFAKDLKTYLRANYPPKQGGPKPVGFIFESVILMAIISFVVQKICEWLWERYWHNVSQMRQGYGMSPLQNSQ